MTRAAQLLDSTEALLSTDFGVLGATQEAVDEPVFCNVLANTKPGGIGLAGGHKYSRASIRLERWSSRPALPDDSEAWEDHDELPWRTLSDSGALQIYNFDPPTPTSPRIDLGDLAWGRAGVWAKGRYRYWNEELPSDFADLATEHWLIKLWPEPRRTNEISGPPRIARFDPSLTSLVDDLFYLRLWSQPEALIASPAQIARRWSVPVGEVISYLQGIHVRGSSQPMWTAVGGQNLLPDTIVTFPAGKIHTPPP